VSEGEARVIAIDGPSGSGKSTVARGVAAALGLAVLDTGAMYRCVALVALEREAALDDAAACGAIARDLDLDLEDGTVRLGGRDVGAAIRGPEVTAAVSTVSAHPPVRAELVRRQREWVATRGGGVVEGRDIGTVVFPDAPLKVFLTANDAERARRRHADEEAAAREVPVESVREALARRDALDSSRATSPLAPAADAVLLDSTGRTAAEVIDEVVGRARAAFEEVR
jgi:cytidylate kinase